MRNHRVVLFVALTLLAGCGGGPGSSTRLEAEPPDLIHGTVSGQGAVNTGIEGAVMATIAEQVPNSVRFRREPLQGAELAVFRAGDDEEAVRTFSDSQGGFSIELPPGSYVLVPRPKETDTETLVAPVQTIPVFPGQINRISVEYEPASLQPRL